MLSSASALILGIPPNTLRHYGEALMALLVATLLCHLLDPVLGDAAALSLYLMAVVFSARYGGRGPALMTLGVGSLLAGYFFIEPRGVLRLDDARMDLQFALHMIVGLLIIHATEQLRATLARALSSEARLRLAAKADMTERMLAKADLDRHAHALQERLKELGCLHAFAQITGHARLTAENLKRIVSSLAAAYQYPEVACARIVVQGQVYQTQNFRESEWLQRSPVRAHGHDLGYIEVAYTEARPPADEGPFLKEERELIDAIALLLAGRLHHWHDRTVLAESETRFRLLVEAMPEILYRGTGYRPTFVSPPVQRLLGFTPAELLQGGDHWIRQLHDDDRERVLREANAVRARPDAEFLTLEYRLWHKDCKSFRWFRDSSRLERDDHGNVVSVVGVLSDITERKDLEHKLQQADQRKEIFLATLAHELRNPLAPIRNAFELIRRSADRPQLARQALEIGERQMGHLLRIVDELLDIARISSGKITLDRQHVDLRSVVEQAVELSRPQIEIGAHQLVVELPESEVMLHVDPMRLTQVMSNLLDNAAKYTNSGGRIRLVARMDSSCQELRIDIEDNGIGIPPNLLPQVFDLYLQGPRTRHRIWHGLGVGLPLAKYLVELHGGELSATSAGPGQGSTFSVRLPMACSATATPAQEAGHCSAATAALKILLVDDDQDVADSTAMLLEVEGHEVRVANDGPAAIKLALDYLPAVMLLDIGLPGMNGYELARRLRAEPALDGTRLIALTGWGTHEDRHKSEQAGMDHHLVKPVDGATLLTQIRDCASSARMPADSCCC